MKVGFTGTRRGMSQPQKDELRRLLSSGVSEFHHGDCVGADEEAHVIALACHVPCIWIHPPINMAQRAYCRTKYDPGSTVVYQTSEKEYLDRNRDIVDATDELLVAPYGPETLQSGTWSTKRYAERKRKHYVLLRR